MTTPTPEWAEDLERRTRDLEASLRRAQEVATEQRRRAEYAEESARRAWRIAAQGSWPRRGGE